MSKRGVLAKRPLTIREIVAWADAYREATGRWPRVKSGMIVGAKGESWRAVDHALRSGRRGLPAGSSLAQLLAEKRGARNAQRLPPLEEEQILRWADLHQQQTGDWPTHKSGTIPGSGGESWYAINVALQVGGRGLPGGSSLRRLLAVRRGARNRSRLPPYTEEQILAWAEAHHQRTGQWPSARSGPIVDAPGETWTAVCMALSHGHRGFRGGSSLPLLLAERLGVRNVLSLPLLVVPQILAWADAFHERAGHWPNKGSGAIAEAPEETWDGVNRALKKGRRGLPGGFSLAELLAVERDVRNQVNIPRLDQKQILAWADAHFDRTGDWPTPGSGSIPEAPGETWSGVQVCLHQGHRGLRGGSSLAKLLAKYRGRMKMSGRSRLSYKKILAWADAHHTRTGQWPTTTSGRVIDAPAEIWKLIDGALRNGSRGLPGGSSLLRLLGRKRGVRHPAHPPALTEEDILSLARLHFRRTGQWPSRESGAITGTPGETWGSIDRALHKGTRGLQPGSSLAKLLARHRSSETVVETRVDLPRKELAEG